MIAGERRPVTPQGAKGVDWCDGCAVVGHTVLSASVGESRAARIAGSSPAIAPIRIVATIPPAHASVGITTAQCLVSA